MGIIGEPKSESFRQIGGYQYESSTAPPAAVTRSNTITRNPAQVLSISSNAGTSPVSYESSVISSRNSRIIPSNAMYRLPHVPFPVTEPESSSSVRIPPPALRIDTRSASTYSVGSHVTVRYQRGRAPTLDLRRFSDIDLATATDTVGEGLSPELKPMESSVDGDEDDLEPRCTSMTTPRMSSTFSFVGAATPQNARSRHTIGGTEDLPARSKSTSSKATTIRKSSQTYPYTNRAGTLEVLHALAMEFPAMPVQPAAVGIAPSLNLSEEPDTAYPDSEGAS